MAFKKDGPHKTYGSRVPVREAALASGINASRIHGFIKSGRLSKRVDKDGRVYVDLNEVMNLTPGRDPESLVGAKYARHRAAGWSQAKIADKYSVTFQAVSDALRIYDRHVKEASAPSPEPSPSEAPHPTAPPSPRRV